MEGKSIWHRVASLVGAKGQGTLRELPTHTRRCPAGHPMALDWTDCPYCKADRNSSPGTLRQAPEPDSSPGTQVREVPELNSSPGTQVREVPELNSSLGTQVRRAPESPAPDPAPEIALTRIHGETKLAGRPLAGVLFTFSWTRTGQLFPLYAGRNYAGTAPMAREGQRTQILLKEDPAVSGTHFLILYQQDTGQYRIADENSTNGTFVNGEPIDSRGTELPDDAQILAGNTLLIFRKVRPPTAEPERRPKGDYYRSVAASTGDEIPL